MLSEKKELELLKTILGENVPTDVLLQCLIQSNFDVSEAINLYFASLTVNVDVTKSIQNGMPIIIRQSDRIGMIGKSDMYCTMTSGNEVYDTISNERYKVVKMFKRSGSSGVYFKNGDVVSIDCHGLWMKAAKVSNYVRWRAPSQSMRSRFRILNLPQGEFLTIENTFSLVSIDGNRRFVGERQEKPLGLLDHNERLHRCFLTMLHEGDAVVSFKAEFTKSALDAMPRPGENVPLVAQESRNSITDVISSTDTMLDEMMAIIGGQEPRAMVAKYLDGAGGNIEIAIEHYFMAKSQAQQNSKTLAIIPMPDAFQEQQIGVTLDTVQEEEVKSTLSQTNSSYHGHSPLFGPVESSMDEFSSQDLKADGNSSKLTLENFTMLSVLGRGSFGAVMMVRYNQDGRIFAIKILKKTNMDNTDEQNAKEERQILQRISHPYISSLVFAFQTPERLYLGMKYYAGGDLFYHLNARGKLPIQTAMLYAAELVLAISYLHTLNILYRDLKPSNIMIGGDGHLGIVDFGLSKQHISSKHHGVKTLSGTAEYVAPEALVQYEDGTRNYGKSYDWWSLGIVLYEMLVGHSPFFHENQRTMLKNIVHAPLEFPHNFDPLAKSILAELLQRKPSSRLGGRKGGVNDIKNHPFFATIDWQALYLKKIPAPWKPKLSSDTDTRYVDPEFIDEDGTSIVYDRIKSEQKRKSNRFSQFSFDFRA